jgi:hypothetical protein
MQLDACAGGNSYDGSFEVEKYALALTHSPRTHLHKCQYATSITHFAATFLSSLPTSHPLSVIDWQNFASAETFDDFPWEDENEARASAAQPLNTLQSWPLN